MGLLSYLRKIGKKTDGACPTPKEAAAAATVTPEEEEAFEKSSTRFSRRFTKLTQQLAASAKSHGNPAVEKKKLTESAATRIKSTRNIDSFTIINHLYALNAELIKQGLDPLTEDEALDAAAPCDMCDREHCDDAELRKTSKDTLRPYLPPAAASAAAAASAVPVDKEAEMVSDLKEVLGNIEDFGGVGVDGDIKKTDSLYYGIVKDILTDLKKIGTSEDVISNMSDDATIKAELVKIYNIISEAAGGGKRARRVRRTKRTKGKSRGRAGKATRVRRNNNNNSNKTKRNKGKKRRTKRA